MSHTQSHFSQKQVQGNKSSSQGSYSSASDQEKSFDDAEIHRFSEKYIFRQLFDEKTWTYTYILADSESREAVIIDPVRDQVERDLTLIAELGLTLTYILDTHIHADHITGSGVLREKTGAKIALGEGARVANPDILLKDGEVIRIGALDIKALSTPGHTDGCTSFYLDLKRKTQENKDSSKGAYSHEDEQSEDEIGNLSESPMLFSGDVLFVRKTGRTDFQQGSPEKMYHSIMDKMYTLPDATRVYPGHDYAGHTMSTIGEEKCYNTRIKADTTLAEFSKTMEELHLPPPKYLDVALPANMKLGLD